MPENKKVTQVLSMDQLNERLGRASKETVLDKLEGKDVPDDRLKTALQTFGKLNVEAATALHRDVMKFQMIRLAYRGQPELLGKYVETQLPGFKALPAAKAG